jgi:hypothetical protein
MTLLWESPSSRVDSCPSGGLIITYKPTSQDIFLQPGDDSQALYDALSLGHEHGIATCVEGYLDLLDANGASS